MISTQFQDWYYQITHWNDHHLSDPPNPSDYLNTIRSTFGGVSEIDARPIFENWDLSAIDDLLNEEHPRTLSTSHRLQNISADMDGEVIRGKTNKITNTWHHDSTHPNGGITKENLSCFTTKHINFMFRKVKTSKQLIKDHTSRDSKIAVIQAAMDTVQTGALEAARMLFYFYATCNIAALIAYLVCSVHLAKAMIGLICRATIWSPVYIQLPMNSRTKKLWRGIKLDEQRAEQEFQREVAAKLAQQTTTLAEGIRKRIRKEKPNQYEEDEDDDVFDPDAFGNGQSDANARVTEPFDEFEAHGGNTFCFAQVHGGLMIYLFSVVGAFILAGLGNPCKFLKYTDWTNDTHSVMNPHRFYNFIYSLPFILTVINNTFSDGAIPWTYLKAAVKGIEPPTSRQMLGFIGLHKMGLQLKAIFLDFILSRDFNSKRDRLNAARVAHQQLLKEHVYFNRTLKSDRINNYFFSRYQVVEGLTGLMLFFEHMVDESELWNSESLMYTDGLSPLPMVIFKVGAATNSPTENKIGQMRWLNRTGNITGANLLFAWRRLMHRCLKMRSRLTPGKRYEYEQIKRELEQFAKIANLANFVAVEDIVEKLIVDVEVLALE